MFEPTPMMRPIIKDDNPNGQYPVWFLLDEVNGTYSAKSGTSRRMSWLKNHLEVTNSNEDLVVPIMVTAAEFNAYFVERAKQKPHEGLDVFLQQRYEQQKPEAVPFREAKKLGIQLKAQSHGVIDGVSTQKYIRVPRQ